MKCTAATKLIAAHVDGETNRLQAYAVRRHLVGCRECAARQDELLALRARMRAEVPRHCAPPALRARVLAALDAVEPARTAPRRRTDRRWWWLASGAAAGCAATVFAWIIGTAVIERQVSDDVAIEAVTSHVRATLGNHLIQVASSNQHTVKPWLSARLDYSPPVRDMQQEGFTLLGGRIDYLDGQPVATLVYRIRDHMIDVFVRPESRRPMTPELRAVRGFNIAHAVGSGMDWLAVSDVSADTLASFVQRLAHDPDGR